MSEMASQKILLVDDNSKVLKLLELRFSQQGYQVSTAERVKDAVVTAIIVKPHVVVAELELPDLNGIEFKKILGSIPALAEVPIIFITPDKGLPVDFQAEPGAPMDHLQKPYTFRELLAKVEANLGRASVRKSALNPSKPQKGVLREMTLTDILQVLAMNKRSCTITLKLDDQNGKIYFQAGRIVDAKAPGLRAEEAFHQLLTWHGADYSVGDEQHDSLEETVTQDTRLLIAEGMRRLVKQDDTAEKVERAVKVSDQETVQDELEMALAAEIEEAAPLAPEHTEMDADRGLPESGADTSGPVREMGQTLPDNGRYRTDQVLSGESKGDPLFEVLPEQGEKEGERDRAPDSSESSREMKEQKRDHEEGAPVNRVAGSAERADPIGRSGDDDDDERAFLKTLIARGLLKHGDAP
jgi:DNA-binding response OmpR family regulator